VAGDDAGGAAGSGGSKVSRIPKVPDLARRDVEVMLEQRLAEAFAALGCFNLAIFGKTGVGKSTLVNAVFGAQVAPTGLGRPVTKGLDYYRHPGGLLGLYDSEGFETGTSGDVILEGLHRLVDERRGAPIDQRIHAVWYLTRWSDRRFEDRQAEFVRALDALGLPVLVVVTQVPSRDGEIHPEALELAEYVESLGLPLRPGGRVHMTNAMADPFTDAPVLGLQELLDATYLVVPEAAAEALTAAQMLSLERKRRAAQGVITKAMALASGVGATPIPFADAALLIPMQVTMIARITAAYGLPAQRSRTMAAVAALALTGGATMAGRYAVTTLLKFVPGGQIAGSAISGAVAGALTRAIGWAWARVCEHALSLPADRADAFWAGSAPQELFMAFMRKSASVASVTDGA
jgi:uncharacterized protein (DUF697 family)